MFHVDGNSKAGKVILVVGIPMFAAFLAFQVRGFYYSFRSLWWPQAPGVVRVSKLDKVYTQHGQHDKAEITYAYDVGGAHYENDTIAFGLFRGMLTWGHARRLLGDYPAGRAVEVSYNPSNPAVSCLRRGGIGWEDLFMLPVCVAGLASGTKTARDFMRRRSQRDRTPKPVPQRL